MHTPEQIRDNLLNLFQLQQLTTYKICKFTGLPRSSVRHLMVDKQIPSLYTLSILCNALHIPLSQLLDPQENHDATLSLQEKQLLWALRALEEPQQKLVWRILVALCNTG